MFEVQRAPSEAKKVRIAIYRGTGRERTVIFSAEPVRFAQLPTEIEEELTSEKPRLVAVEIPHERKKLLPVEPAPATTAASLDESDDDSADREL